MTKLRTFLPALALLIVGLVLVLILVQATSGAAQAALGNSGVPVRCVPARSGQIIQSGTAEYFNCVAADGTPFTSGQRVPDGYYLLVTDVLVLPDGGTTTNSITDLYIFDSYSTSSRRHAFRMRGTTTASYSEHFNVPYMVLPAGDRLEGLNSASSQDWVQVYISGLLVNNVTFMPLVTH